MNDGYYHFEDDLKKYPDAWCYVVWSKRGAGKTYSGLLYSYNEKIPIIYMKRTNDDVNLLCENNKFGFDASPYVPLNRDQDMNVKAIKINEGLGGFWKHETDPESGSEIPDGLPISYCLSCNAIKKFKGFDFSRCDWILFDEFIPQLGERISRKEGDMILDLYMTVSRDRQKRGRKPLKLVLFANAEEISTPITNTLEIVDIMADLNATGQTHFYDTERGIMLHHITPEEFPLKETEKDGIYQAMKNTKWGAKSFDGSFANNDFSNVVKQSIKSMSPYIHIRHNMNDYYVYLNKNNGKMYMCHIKGKCLFDYDLNYENDQKRFYMEHQVDLWNACVEDRLKFEKYSMYDIIMNYKKFFNIY